MRKQIWLVFSYNGKVLCKYTVSGTFKGEMEQTRALLAYENHVSVDDIEISYTYE